ncbi:MAG: PhoH family protein [Flexistipes sinusarabici]|uniref:PhoH-like protein n=1 Tax=Flexistipes sinusarabici TaxID=2352 RepID=A0A5D0MMY0_FLESI|nr:PhoH family protein [Flexistipes sinusarabici]TYB32608.1 MAG: PhoH family protein [Flexistipes sinusarabici]
MAEKAVQQKEIQVEETLVPEILGKQDEYLKMIKKELSINIAVFGNNFVFSGNSEAVEKGVKLLEHLISIAKTRNIGKSDITYALRMINSDKDTDVQGVLLDSVKVSGRVKEVVPKSQKQKEYLGNIKNNDVVFGIGPAGTGKTYLAMAMAVNMYLTKRVSRIILTRPAVEAGENLGFLPGDIAAKINPYLRPLYDALYSMLDVEKAALLIEKGVIELAPLAFMRGRTLNDSFVILDEAQNTTMEQMKMFLTRLGFHSKAVITGDITQIDLPVGKGSGLVLVRNILRDVEGVKFVEFSEKDVIRHPLVQKIIKAYEKYEERIGNGD